ncbi:hypothetical protein POSPLADRAFT_1073427 [Postia placenta MAD-698-R-SB12]|uniref:Uncharacterized protein n=1 Tax=Postia placenta MAD-698-R-SB12 TaxID=670580 RepID=A0A1X6N9E6_9APHY|nr:hypothetical protein POSPLADRAFT_1073427 [Postia placenta MAD-698-R-SB12]OSX65265.1 hypothetical protein POSPLADRAFT_1073427 [Postia placenta MAD-698-R-SB12]
MADMSGDCKCTIYIFLQGRRNAGYWVMDIRREYFSNRSPTLWVTMGFLHVHPHFMGARRICASFAGCTSRCLGGPFIMRVTERR